VAEPEDSAARARIAEIDLGAGAPEIRATNLLGVEQGAFFDLLGALAKLEKDESRAGILVRVGSARLGWSRSAELARGLRRLREQGRVVACHADSLTNSSYGLLAEACDQIWVSPAGGVDTVGIAAELMFARDLLSRVNIEADILQVGRFKGTGETLTRSEASEEVKESIQGALGGIRQRWHEGVSLGRATRGAITAGATPEGQLAGRMAVAALEKGPYSPTEARALGLIDGVGYAREALDALRLAVGAPAESRVEPAFTSQSRERGGTSGVVDVVRALSGARRPGKGGKRGGRVVVLRASGAIAMERSRGMLGESSGIVARTMIRQIRALAEDDRASVVVLRIDSPGGSALASDLLWYELMALRKKKPLVISVADMAASGGYYMACAGSKIVAEETSIVGSIGVVGGKVAIGGALAQFGVKVETIPAAPDVDPIRAGYESMAVRWDAPTRARVLSTMQSIYDLFVARVADGRAMSPDRVAGFAEGRIFSGREALSRGMIDALGGLGDAIQVARQEASLGPDAEVKLAEVPGGLFDVLDLDEDGDEARAALVRRDGSLLDLAGVPAETRWHAASFRPLLENEHALVALPFAFLVR
jgi:protease-4